MFEKKTMKTVKNKQEKNKDLCGRDSIKGDACERERKHWIKQCAIA
jgi:hypothetical protein